VLIKNNHPTLAGSLRSAIERAHRNRRGTQPIEVEVRTLAELEEALNCGAEAILLDNMPVAEVKAAVERCSKADRRIPLESSGGIRLENVREYAETGVDFISVGALTHSAPAVDLSLRIVPA
jgi:nicotinate-nucleotide pyrophosphorylase (carboxylating)